MPALTIKAVEEEEELRLANELMAKSFQVDYFSSMRWLETSGATYPGFRPEHTRIALCDGELAGALRVNTETIRLGEARLKMGGLGMVATSARYRHRGVGSTLMEHTLKYLHSRRYHVSMLFGIPNFYHRFGYATMLADHIILADALEVSAKMGPEHLQRPVKPGDIRAIQRIHEANDAEVPCSILRSAAHFTNRWARFKKAWVLTNRSGKVMAYALPGSVKGGQLTIHEAGVTSSAVHADLLAGCAAMAQREYAGRIRFHLPPGHPFAQFLLQYESVHEMHVVRNAGGMMAIVDIDETLENLIPEWENLLSKSSLRGLRCEATLMVDRRPYRIRANRGAVDVAQTPGKNKLSLSAGDLAQLLTGYRYLEEILDAKRRIMTKEARQLLAVLFPKRSPYIWTFDRF